MLRPWLEEVVTAPPPWLWPVLIPLSLLYAGSITLHRVLYRLGVLKPGKLPKPVVCVGNLTAGGGGKTPVAMWLAETLSKQGVRPAILSRGYGRKSDGILVVDPEGPWSRFGDEPFMMASKLKDVPVVVSANRHLAGLELLKHRDVDLFILDDGFQHYALYRDVNIVVVDGQSRFGNGKLLPAGVLREPVSRLQGADFIIVTKCPQRDAEFENYLNKHSKAPVLWADYASTGLRNVDTDKPAPGDVGTSSLFVAFCGIAGPGGFRLTLEKAGIEVAELLVFPDHHAYSEVDVDSIVEAAVRNRASALVTTEKDAVRWPRSKSPIPVYSLAVRPEIGDTGDILKSILTLVQSPTGNV